MWSENKTIIAQKERCHLSKININDAVGASQNTQASD